MSGIGRRTFIKGSIAGAIAAPAIVHTSVSIAQASKVIKTAHPPWTHTSTVGGITAGLVESVGYQWEITTANIVVAIAALAKGDIDIMHAFTHVGWEEHYDKYWRNFDLLGTSHGPLKIALGVPDFVTDISTCQDLKDREKEFGGEVISIAVGTSIHTNTVKAVKAYGLDLEVKPTSEHAMVAAFVRAVKRKEPILISPWRPNYMMIKYPIKMLKDPMNAFGLPQFISYVGRAGFAKDHPRLAHLLPKVSFTLSELERIMGEKVTEKKMDPHDAGKEWLQEHPDRIEKWTRGYS